MFSSKRQKNEALSSSHSTNLNCDLEKIKKVDYRRCDVFKIKQTNHKNTSEKIWVQETGYINNLQNTGEPALLIHHLDGLFSIEAEGTALNVNDFFEFMRNKYPNLMKKIETDKKLLHLIACYMKDSIAQEIANKLNRTVIIYGDPEKELKSSLKSTTDSYYTFSSLYKKKSQFFNETQVIDTKGVVKIKRSIAKARAIFPKENELEKKLKSPEYQKLVQDRWNRTDMLQKKSESATTAYSASFSHNNTASTSTTAFQNSPPNQIFSEQKSALGANAKDIRPFILDQLVKTKDIGDFLEMTKKMLDTVAPEEFKRIFSEPAVVKQCRYFWDKSSLAMGDKAKILKLPSEISQGAESSQVENMVIGLKNKIQEAIQTLGEVKTRDKASQKMLDAQRKAEQKHDTEMKKRQIERAIESQQNLLAFSQDNHIRRLQSQETKIQQDFQTQQEKK